MYAGSGVRGCAVLVDVEPTELDLFGDSEHTERLDAVHQREGDHERRDGDDRTPGDLDTELLRAAAVEQALDRRRDVGARGRRQEVLAGGEEPEADRAPDPAEPVHCDRADRVVDPQPFEELDPEHADGTGDGTDTDRTER